MSNFYVPWHLPFPIRDLSTTKVLFSADLSQYSEVSKIVTFKPNNQIPTSIYSFRKTNGKTRMCVICPKLTIKALERRH